MPSTFTREDAGSCNSWRSKKRMLLAVWKIVRGAFAPSSHGLENASTTARSSLTSAWMKSTPLSCASSKSKRVGGWRSSTRIRRGFSPR